MLTLLTLLVSPFIIFFSYNFDKSFGKYTEVVMKEHQNADSLAEETFRDIKTVMSLGAEEKFITRYWRIVKDCCKRAIICTTKSGIHYSGMGLSTQLADGLLFLSAVLIINYQRSDFPSQLFASNCTTIMDNSVDVCFQNLTALSDTCMEICNRVNTCWFDEGSNSCLVGGEVVVVVMAILQSFPGIGGSFSSLINLAKSRMSAAYFLQVIEHEDAMDSMGSNGTTPESNRGDIVFKDVDFKYASRDMQVLKQLNFTIHENEMIGIVGESGSGKSTILKLLMRLYAPTAGTITWDGVDVTTLSTAWIRDQISYVAQEPVLFSGTIRENLLYGREGCTEEEMVEAAKLVEADAFIRSFPKGYDTYVGELGSSLSGGQKQRIAIARALIRNPRILVLDEATSALDTQSETIVQNAMETIRRKNEAKGKGLSIVIVAHRLSSIRSCDRIVVVEEGKIVEEGDHESLLAKGGIYAGLYKSQETLDEGEVQGIEGTEKKEETEADVEAKKNEEQIEKEKEAEVGDSKKDEKEKADKKDKPKKYSLFSLYQYFGATKCILWIAFIGVVFTAMYPAGYTVIMALMQALPFRLDVNSIWSDGMVFTLMMVIVAIVDFVGQLLWWDLSSVVKENMIVTVRSKSFVKLLSQSVAYYDEKEHSPGKTFLSILLIPSCNHLRTLHRCSEAARLYG